MEDYNYLDFPLGVFATLYYKLIAPVRMNECVWGLDAFSPLKSSVSIFIVTL